MDKKRKTEIGNSNQKIEANVLAASLVEKMRSRILEIEKMRLGQLNRPLVREWKRLKLIEKEILA